MRTTLEMRLDREGDGIIRLPAMTRFPYDIFISHQHADKTWARQLAVRLGKP